MASFESLFRIINVRKNANVNPAIVSQGVVEKILSKYFPAKPSDTAGIAVAKPTFEKNDKAKTRLFFINSLFNILAHTSKSISNFKGSNFDFLRQIP